MNSAAEPPQLDGWDRLLLENTAPPNDPRDLPPPSERERKRRALAELYAPALARSQALVASKAPRPTRLRERSWSLAFVSLTRVWSPVVERLNYGDSPRRRFQAIQEAE